MRIASAAEVAVCTSKSFISRTAFRVSRTATSSSTRSMRRFIVAPQSFIVPKAIHEFWQTKNGQDSRKYCKPTRPNQPQYSHEERALLRYYRTVDSFYVENFGCRTTQADGAAIDRQLRDQGLERAGGPNQAGIVVLNTCTVTASAD